MVDDTFQILIAEDSLTQALELQHMLEGQHYRVRVAKNGQIALQMVRDDRPAILIADIIMPVMDGYELCRTIRADDELKDIPIILLTSLSDPSDVLRGLEVGADCFFTKPFDSRELISRILTMLLNSVGRLEIEESTQAFEATFGNDTYIITTDRRRMLSLLLSTFENAVKCNHTLEDRQRELELARQKIKQLESTAKAPVQPLVEVDVSPRLFTCMEALSTVLCRQGGLVDRHICPLHQDVSGLAGAIAEMMGFADEQLQGLRVAGLMHDIGMSCVEPEVRLREGPLEASELALVHSHPQVGCDLLTGAGFPWPVETIVLQHHERMDGSGYPNGISRREVLWQSRILGVADVVAAICEDRPHRKALPLEAALEEISSHRGTRYDKPIVEACIAVFHEKRFSFDAPT